MSPSRPRRRLPGGAFPMLLALLAVTAESAAAQSIVGRVVLEGSGEAVDDATVVLLSAGLERLGSVATDGDGGFTFDVGAPGSYVLVVERPGFASHVSRPLTLSGSGFFEEQIEVASAPAVPGGRLAGEGEYLTVREDHLVASCGEGQGVDGTGVLVAVVVEEGTGRTVPGALVVTEWAGGDGQPSTRWAAAPVGSRGDPSPDAPLERRELATGDVGFVVLCGVPAGRPIGVHAAGGGRRSPTERTVVEPGRAARVELALDLPGRSDLAAVEPRGVGMGSVLGRVTDFRTGEPVEAAQVRLPELGRTALTDARGRFIMEGVPSGQHALVVEHVAFPHQEIRLPVLSGTGHDVDIQLVAEAVELAPLRVTVRSTRWFRDMEGFTRRAREGRGYFFPPEEVERRSPSVLLDLLRTVPGVRVGSASQDAPTTLAVRGRRCHPAVWVDRTPWPNGDPFTAIRGSELEAVEVYRGLTEIPAEFAGREDACAAVVVWTRTPPIIS